MAYIDALIDSLSFMNQRSEAQFSTFDILGNLVLTSSNMLVAYNRIILWRIEHKIRHYIAQLAIYFPCTALKFLDENHFVAASSGISIYTIHETSRNYEIKRESSFYCDYELLAKEESGQTQVECLGYTPNRKYVYNSSLFELTYPAHTFDDRYTRYFNLSSSLSASLPRLKKVYSPACSLEQCGDYLSIGFYNGMLSIVRLPSCDLLANLLVGYAPIYALARIISHTVIACGNTIYGLNYSNLRSFRMLWEFDYECVGITIHRDRFLMVYLQNAEYLPVIEVEYDGACLRVKRRFALKPERKQDDNHKNKAAMIRSVCSAGVLIFCLFADGTIAGFNGNDFRYEVVYKDNHTAAIVWSADRLWLFPAMRSLVL